MKIPRRELLVILLGMAPSTVLGGSAPAAADVVLGRLPTGAAVTFTPVAPAGWGVVVAGGAAPRIAQDKPVRLEIFNSDDDVRELATAYATVARMAAGIEARAEVASIPGVIFHVRDQWTVKNAVVSVRRDVAVTGRAPSGFASSLVFTLDSAVGWKDVQYLAPGALYGDPTYDGDRSAGGTLNDAARRFVMREDVLPAPLFGLSFGNGASIAVLDPSPRGDTTVDESKLTQAAMTDARFQFGALGARQAAGDSIEFGFWFPGTVTTYGGNRSESPSPRRVRRYHPIGPDTVHRYDVEFRFGEHESFHDLTRNAWRWAWDTLKPAVTYIDVDLVRRVLTDHLVAQAATIDGRTAIPFVLSTVSDKLQWNWTMAAMGFVGKNLECADQLLREGDRDTTERGRKMRQTGLAVIDSMIQALPTVPLPATGYDLATGKPHEHVWLAPWLRNATEDMRVLIRAYRRERALGRKHPEWFTWVKTYVDWLVQQQREDGSFPRRWKAGSNEAEEPSGTTSYAPVPLLVLMSEETGDPRYAQAAVRAAEFVWASWGSRGLFIGGASDNPNITDKEAGMLSLEAFLSLYESSRDPRWLERAQAAGDFAESWIWIWNLPMPLDADDSELHWKKGVPTVGLQGITAMGAGGTDEYLDWAVPSYAKLYTYTKDEHYLDVARVLLHDTKSMLALPGRLYDMKGPGWQQENWRMGPGGNGRGVGSHRFWLPWVSANHLYGITGLEEYDPALFKRLSERPTSTSEPAAGSTNARVKNPAVPGEQAPPADPGQNNFGGPRPFTGAGAPNPPVRPPRPEPAFGTVSLEEISMSDPFIYPDEKSRTYYLTGSGGRLYKSKDLKTWTGPYRIIDLAGTWMDGHFVAAAEIHHIGDRYYLAGTWNDHGHLIENVPRRYNVPTNQTQLLVADSPEGPFKPLVPEYDFCLGPGDWDIIDGTLYQEDGTTYMVFVHEWTQIIDGTMAYMPLSKDLTRRTADPTTIFRASEAPWAKEMNSIGEATFGLKMPGWVTDGPQLFRTQTGRLGMLWSSWGEHRYAQGVAYSTSGSIKGPWVQEKEALKGDNSGHGMLFRTFEGKLLFIIHHAEGNGPRKPQIWDVDDSGDKLVLESRYGG